MADVFVILDDTAFSKGDYINRNRVLHHDGPKMLTIPVKHTGGQAIRDVTTVGEWRESHTGLINSCYRKAPYGDEAISYATEAVGVQSDKLAPIAYSSFAQIVENCHITTKVVAASQLGIGGKGSDRILDICKSFDATTYLSGPQGKDYLKEKDFAAAGIEVIYTGSTHPAYPQFNSEVHVPGLAAIDALANLGWDGLRELVTAW